MRILYFAVSSSLLIAMVLLARRLFRRKLSPGALYALWLIPLVRLLTPFAAVEIPVHGQGAEFLNLPYAVFEEAVEGLLAGSLDGETPKSAEMVSGEYPEAALTEIVPENAAAENILPEKAEVNTEKVVGADMAPANVLQVLEANLQNAGAAGYFCLTWMLGSFALGAYAFLSNRKLRRSVGRMQRGDENCPLPVCCSEAVVSPCLFGLFHPCILLNDQVREDEGLYRQVLRHELTHYRQKDHIWTFFRVAVCVLYWWNPLVWAGAACSREDAELACDSRVVRGLATGERKEYGLALLLLLNQAQSGRRLMYSATSMSGRRKDLRRRIEGITEDVSTKRGVLFLVCAALVTVSLYGCAVPDGGSYVDSGWSKVRGQTGDLEGPMLEVGLKLQDDFQSRLFYYEVYQKGQLTQRSTFAYGFLDSLDQTIQILLNMPQDAEGQYSSMNILLDYGTVSIEGPRELGGTYSGACELIPLENKNMKVEPGDDLILMAAYGQSGENEEKITCEKLMELSEEERREALADSELTVLLHMVLSDLAENDLDALYREKEYPAPGQAQTPQEPNGQISDLDAEEFVQNWVQAFVDRDGDALVEMMTDEAEQRMQDDGMLSVEDDGNYFGWSSPWPMFGNELYRILSCTEEQAEILYYAGDSTPHLYVWRQTLTLKKENKTYRADVSFQEMLEAIGTLEDFFRAYPEGAIAGTPMDYASNGLGEALNENAKQSEDSYYEQLFDPASAAAFLLNLAEGPAGARVWAETTEEEATVHVTFLKDGSTVDVIMTQPYGGDGIWVPQGIK